MMPAALRPVGRDPGLAVVDVDGVPMSARVAAVAAPRAVLVALHGGAVTSGYFDAPGWLSLLRAGTALGFTVIALDRPGYGSSAPHGEEMASPARRVGLAYGAVDRLLAARPRGAGIFLVGHSLGCVLAVRMAAGRRGRELLGLELAGIGRQPQPWAAAVMGERMQDGPGRGRTRTALRDILWGPGYLYPDDADAVVTSAAPGYEGGEVRGWMRDFPALAARVRVPVRYSLGDHEKVWCSGPTALAEVAALFTASPRVVADEQAEAGHNLSLGFSALAYHLKVLSFAEECVLGRGERSVG
jgi:pimeloyl-ACP methyl ester carboxylesterase